MQLRTRCLAPLLGACHPATLTDPGTCKPQSSIQQPLTAALPWCHMTHQPLLQLWTSHIMHQAHHISRGRATQKCKQLMQTHSQTTMKRHSLGMQILHRRIIPAPHPHKMLYLATDVLLGVSVKPAAPNSHCMILASYPPFSPVVIGSHVTESQLAHVTNQQHMTQQNPVLRLIPDRAMVWMTHRQYRLRMSPWMICLNSWQTLQLQMSFSCLQLPSQHSPDLITSPAAAIKMQGRIRQQQL